jgi:predicted phosphohydrolase
MDDLILKTIIFILKDKKTNKPVVMTHFQGFENDDEAKDFSHFLTDTFCGDGTPIEPGDLHPKRTLH